MTIVAREALHMRVSWETAPTSDDVPEGLGVRPVQPEDGAALGTLMSDAYRGTVDDDGETPEEALAEAQGAIGGAWGPLIEDASLMALAGDDVVAAVITVRDVSNGMSPLLAFALTDPAWQRRGIGGWLIRESICRLASLGVTELHLAVTRGSPAQRLYERLGFRIVS